MSLSAAAISAKCAKVLLDANGVRWPAAELEGWVYAGQREICALKPDAYVVVSNITTSAGTKQAVPGALLVDVTRNMGADGSTPGRTVTPITMDVLDVSVPNWHSMDAGEAKHWVYDPRNPTVFYLYPPSPGNVMVEVATAVDPPDGAVVVGDHFESALIDYVLWRAFGKDTESSYSPERSNKHREAFLQSVGIRGQVEGRLAASTNVPPAIQQQAVRGG